MTLSVGHSVSYLTDAVASAREGYYVSAVVDAGEPAGLWHGAAAELLGLSGEVDADLMEAVYTHLLDPRDEAAHDVARWGEAAALCSGHKRFRTPEEVYAALAAGEPGAGPERRADLRALAERRARQAVQFIDATTSAPKSVTVLAVAAERAENEARAAGREAEAAAWAAHREAIEQAVLAGARASIDYLQDVAGYGRVGHHGGAGGRWIDAHDWVASTWLQHDSRDRDPQLHVHAAILNRQLCADGQWRALDTKAIHLHRAAASVIGERVMEAHLAGSLGVRFVPRADGHGREVAGVDPQVMELFSSRARAIGPKQQQLMDDFRSRFGREPTPLERSQLAQRATMATRAAKSHDGESPTDRLERWERECRAALGGGLARVAHTVLVGRADVGDTAAERWEPSDVIDRALAALGERTQSWTRSDLMRAVSEALPGQLGLSPDEIRPLLDRLTDQALERAVQLTPDELPVPDELVLSDGSASTTRPGSARYATTDQLAAERRLRELAIDRVDARCSVAEADAVVQTVAAAGLRLGDDQAAVVRGVLSSGAAVQVVAAAAGTGKSVVMGAVAEGWRRHGGRVRGLAPSQVAADVLSAEGVTAKNLAAWRLAVESGRELVRAGDLLIVDEAGMASTADLLAVTERARAAGATVLMVGDPRQLGAVGPGGALADLAERAERYELVEVRRFVDRWEREASLRLRDGDLGALDDYDKAGRLLDGGTAEQAEARAARSWLADTLAGKQSLLVVGSNEAAARVSGQLRAQLVRFGRVSEEGAYLGRDGNVAGIGDLVQARRNDWSIMAQPVNRATYRVVEVLDDSGLRVEPAAGGRARILPARYVAEDLTLAYASTVHSAQGRTVDTAHAVIGGGMDSASAYVALSRGRERNTAHVVTVRTAQDSPVGEAATVEPRTARAVLADTIEQAKPQMTALAEQEAAEAETRGVQWNVERLAARVAEATAGRMGRWLDHMTADGTLTDAQRTQLAVDASTGALERLLRTAELAGHDPEQVLRDAAASHSLRGARSVAQVLHHRIRESALDLSAKITCARDLVPRRGLNRGFSWLLGEHAERIDQRRHELGAQLADEPPAWLTAALGQVPTDAMGRVEWEQRAGWAAAAREATGHDEDARALGIAPPPGLVEKRALWSVAQAELDPDGLGPEEASMSDGRLRIRVAAAERERAWAPRHVAEELAAVEERTKARSDDAVLWEAHADALPAEQAERLRGDAARAREEANELAVQAVQLREADAAWRRWLDETAVTREMADRARAELAARGVEVDGGEERVTAAEWLAAHTETVTDDQDVREVAEAAVQDDVHSEAANARARGDALDRGDRAVAEVPDVDIRETAVVDESQHTDTGRRVPTLEETAAAVERARAALAEIQARESLDEPVAVITEADIARDADADVDELVDSS